MIAAQGGYQVAAVSLAALYSSKRDYDKTYLWLLIAEGLGSVDLDGKKSLYVEQLDTEEIAMLKKQAQTWLSNRKGGKK
jgi:hypothetical protein